MISAPVFTIKCRLLMMSKTKERRLCGEPVTVAAATERFPTLLFGFCGSMGCVADCYTINLGTLISGNILLSSLVHAMPPGREKVSVVWSETVY